MVSSGDRVFFRTFLHFLSIHKMFIRHSKIIHIREIKRRKILCILSFFLSRYQVFHREFIFFNCLITYKCSSELDSNVLKLRFVVNKSIYAKNTWQRFCIHTFTKCIFFKVYIYGILSQLI